MIALLKYPIDGATKQANIISSMTTMKNFMMADYREGTEKKDYFDRLNKKIFFLIENQDIDRNQKNDKKKKKKDKKSKSSAYNSSSH